ncbi:TPA: hypothetical protein N0F65_002658 [Lagenidium giganteum]|uniref:RBR-type E3 ubiquitin transferase n=1 Tax=Lagenidium giganteum TaxID=4803 RepID=A0AAV2Z120_9STRA|nr:TPA: hypothetical protein N0F65_002658 [Lagenidium giganteum]
MTIPTSPTETKMALRKSESDVHGGDSGRPPLGNTRSSSSHRHSLLRSHSSASARALSGSGSFRNLTRSLHSSTRSLRRSMTSLLGSSEETFYCQICFENVALGDAFKLTACGHRFCRACLEQYLDSKISDAQLYPVCFHEDTTPSTDSAGTDASARDNPNKVCGVVIPQDDICAVVSVPTWRKYQTRSLNHCVAPGGCNHMTCISCDTDFCWLCGAIVDKSVFPEHFQWWNVTGCPGAQMTETDDETLNVSWCSRALRMLYVLVLGVPAYILAAVLTVLSWPFPAFRRSVESNFRAGISSWLRTFMTCFMVIVALAGLVVVAALGIVLSPMIALYATWGVFVDVIPINCVKPLPLMSTHVALHVDGERRPLLPKTSRSSSRQRTLLSSQSSSAGALSAYGSVRTLTRSLRSSSRGLMRSLSNLLGAMEETFYCQICFENVAVSEAFKLTTCGHPFCRACLEQYLDSKISDAQLYPVKIAKDCPGCGHPVEKNGGCNHMTCVSCGTDFCWLCGAIVDKSVFPEHFQWWNVAGCPGAQMTETDDETLRMLYVLVLGVPTYILAAGDAINVVTFRDSYIAIPSPRAASAKQLSEPAASPMWMAQPINVMLTIGSTGRRVWQLLNDLVTPPPVPAFYCQGCLDDVPATFKFVLSTCGHAFCFDCVTGYLETKIHDAQVNPVCFHDQDANGAGGADTNASTPGKCGREVSEEDILLVVSPEVWAKYQRFKLHKTTPNARDCPFCGHSQMCSSGSVNPQVTCVACFQVFCFVHSNAHPGKSCKAHIKATAKTDKLTAACIRGISKPCPGCQAPVQKNGGCNHMTCSVCDTDFCWLCGKQIAVGMAATHYEWWNLRGCPNGQFLGVDGADATDMSCFARFKTHGMNLSTTVLAVLSWICMIPIVLACAHRPLLAKSSGGSSRRQTLQHSQSSSSRALSAYGSFRDSTRSLHRTTWRREETFYCQICFENVAVSEAFKLTTCGHPFCRACLEQYLDSKISDAQLYPVCFHEDVVSIQTIDQAVDGDAVAVGSSTVKKVCGVVIPQDDICAVVSVPTWRKYQTFLFNKTHQHARQCPYCDHSQDYPDGQEDPACTCEACGKTFCFHHSNAHVDSSCAEHEKRMAESERLDRAAISKIAKDCPGCGHPVEKNGGCNHMTCISCDTDFCWLCGAIVDKAVFPEHFQWWNVAGCPGAQMTETDDETLNVSWWSRAFRMLYVVVLGVPAYILAALLTLLSWPFPSFRRSVEGNFLAGISSWLRTFMTGFVAVAVVVGVVAGVVLVVVFSPVIALWAMWISKCPNCATEFCWNCGKFFVDEPSDGHFLWWHPDTCATKASKGEDDSACFFYFFMAVGWILFAVCLVPVLVVMGLLWPWNACRSPFNHHSGEMFNFLMRRLSGILFAFPFFAFLVVFLGLYLLTTPIQGIVIVYHVIKAIYFPEAQEQQEVAEAADQDNAGADVSEMQPESDGTVLDETERTVTPPANCVESMNEC